MAGSEADMGTMPSGVDWRLEELRNEAVRAGLGRPGMLMAAVLRA